MIAYAYRKKTFLFLLPFFSTTSQLSASSKKEIPKKEKNHPLLEKLVAHRTPSEKEKIEKSLLKHAKKKLSNTITEGEVNLIVEKRIQEEKKKNLLQRLKVKTIREAREKLRIQIKNELLLDAYLKEICALPKPSPKAVNDWYESCLLYTSPSPRDA